MEEFGELRALVERGFKEEGDVEKAFSLVQRSQGIARTHALAQYAPWPSLLSRTRSVSVVVLWSSDVARASTTQQPTQGALRQGGGDDRPVGALAIPGRSGQAHGKGPVSLQLTGWVPKRAKTKNENETKRTKRSGESCCCLSRFTRIIFVTHTLHLTSSHHEMNERRRRARESALFLGTRELSGGIQAMVVEAPLR
jgi:hypothetical protein